VEVREEAARYCALIERAGAFERGAFCEAVVLSLARLLVAVVELPSSGEIGETGNDHGVPRADREARHDAVKRKLGDWDVYWTAGPTPERAEPVCGSLADDLADIWWDLADGLRRLDHGSALRAVTAGWRFEGRNHWMRHATEALRVLEQRV
jgi:hypothetical protein